MISADTWRSVPYRSISWHAILTHHCWRWWRVLWLLIDLDTYYIAITYYDVVPTVETFSARNPRRITAGVGTLAPLILTTTDNFVQNVYVSAKCMVEYQFSLTLDGYGTDLHVPVLICLNKPLVRRQTVGASNSIRLISASVIVIRWIILYATAQSSK